MYFGVYSILSLVTCLQRSLFVDRYKTFRFTFPHDFRRKGPSKENRKDPIVGLELLLDANQIPIGMELFPGNESEKPILRNVIKKLKDKNQITGKTIHVADKGLNCAQNIAFFKENGDGYLFSKSVTINFILSQISFSDKLNYAKISCTSSI